MESSLSNIFNIYCSDDNGVIKGNHLFLEKNSTLRFQTLRGLSLLEGFALIINKDGFCVFNEDDYVSQVSYNINRKELYITDGFDEKRFSLDLNIKTSDLSSLLFLREYPLSITGIKQESNGHLYLKGDKDYCFFKNKEDGKYYFSIDGGNKSGNNFFLVDDEEAMYAGGLDIRYYLYYKRDLSRVSLLKDRKYHGPTFEYHPYDDLVFVYYYCQDGNAIKTLKVYKNMVAELIEGSMDNVIKTFKL